MNNLFKEGPKKAKRCYKVENLNPERGIFSSLRVSEDGKKYVTCLVLVNRTIKTAFLDYPSALGELRRYRQLYKQKKVK